MSQITHFFGVKSLAWKSGGVKFWTNIMSGCEDVNKDDGLYWTVLYCIGLYLAVMDCTGLYLVDCTGLQWTVMHCTRLCLVDCIGLYWGVMGCNRLHWAVLSGLYWTLLGCTGLYKAVQGCTGLRWAALGCTRPLKYWEKLRCHPCDGQTNERRKVENRAVFWKTRNCSRLYLAVMG